MPRQDDYYDEDSYLDFDGEGSFKERDEDSDSFFEEAGWNKREVDLTWWNPLTWIAWIVISIINVFTWTWWRSLIRWDEVSDSTSRSVIHVIVELIVASITIGIGYVLPSSEFRGYIYAIFAVLLIGLLIDSIIIITFRALKIFAARQ